MNIKNLFKNSFLYSAGYFLSSGISFFLLPVYTRYLTPTDYGVLSVLGFVGSILAPFYKLGQDASIARFYFDYYKEPGALKKYLGTIIPQLVLVNVIFTTILLLLGNQIFPKLINNIPFAPFVIITVLSTHFSIIMGLAVELIRVMEKAVLFITIQIITLFITIILNIYFVVYLKTGALGIITAGCIINGISFIVGLIFFYKQMKLSFDISVIKNSLAFGLPFIPHNMAYLANRIADVYILNQFVPLSEVGLYSLATRIASILLIVQDSFNGAWNPTFQRMALEEKEGAKTFFAKATTYYFVILLFAILLFSLLSNEIIRLLTTPKFYTASALVPLLLSALFFKGVYLLSTQSLIHKKKMRYMPIATISGALIGIALNLLLIPKWGTHGALYSNLVSNLLMGGICFYYAQKFYKINYDYVRIGIATAIFVSILFVGLMYTPKSLFAAFSYKLFLTVTFILLCRITNVITKDDITFSKAAIKFIMKNIKNKLSFMKS